MKKLLSLILSAVILCSFATPAFAAELNAIGNSNVKRMEVSLDKAITNQTYTQTLKKDSATLFGQTGTVTSIGQFVDLTNVLPRDSKVVSVTLYCPRNVKVTQSPYTAITSFLINNGSTSPASVKFLRTDKPTSECTTARLMGTPANVKWFIQIQGNVISQYTGMDGFTVNGGCKMIIEYK